MQRYEEIPSNETLSNSLTKILNNDKTALSCSSGSSFPTVNVQQGMLCYRIDHNKLYICTDPATPTWKVVADSSGDARLLDGGSGNAINYDKQNLNSWENMPTGFYEGSNLLNAPSGDTAWRILQIRQGNSDGYSTQLAFGKSTGRMFTRFQSGGMWNEWQEVYAGTGSTINNLNADKLDDYHAGNASGQIPVNNGTVNVNLNADKLDGYDAGNEVNQIPINNGVVNAGLNADRLGGYHAGNASGQIPVSNGSVNKNLNAEYLSGVPISQVVTKNQSGNVTSTINSATITNLTVTNFNSRSYTATQQGSRSTQTQASDVYDYDSTSGSGNITKTYYYYHTIPGISAGSYNLYNIIQRLINVSHTHKTERKIVNSNCNCACACDCDCDSDNGCFIAGLTMTKRGVIQIDQIVVGDEIFGADDEWHEVVGIAMNVVGNRKVFEMLHGGIVTADHVVYQGELAYTPSLKDYEATRDCVLIASNGIKGKYLASGDVSEIDCANLKTYPEKMRTISPICKESFVGFLNGERVLFAGQI